ncbi:MAG: GNAT family N-acetyltransferase [bacterium]|nr:GNAT family N-acetyltransferase [bacterium]
MKIFEAVNNKKDYIRLLLLADEQEDMIDRYIGRGTMFVLEDNGVKAVCIVTDEGDGNIEIKNIAVEPQYQKMGYGRKLIEFVTDRFKDKYSCLSVGTGDSPLTVPFYEKCGFQRSHVIKNFFTDNYDHPIFECGKQLVDMVYLKKIIKK